MVVRPEQLTWCEKGYTDAKGVRWQGYLWAGVCPWKVPAKLTDDQKLGRAVMATESPRCHLDATQSYDSMALTTGAIQWAEMGTYLVTKLLGACKEQDPALLLPLREAMQRSKVSLEKNDKGAWRWKLASGDWVDSKEKQNAMLRLKSNGTAGTWDDASKAVNALWVAGVASVFQSPVAQEVQLAFTFARIRMFVLPEAKAILWGGGTPVRDEGVYGAVRAIYTSYAANNQIVARDGLLRACRKTKAPLWSPEWVSDVLEELAFGSGIAIYPKRYLDLLPVVEPLYGVKLPPIEDTEGLLRTTLSMQQALIRLGYDLGPKGADGVEGPKTRAALLLFQQRNRTSGLRQDGLYTEATRKLLLGALGRLGDPGQ